MLSSNSLYWVLFGDAERNFFIGNREVTGLKL
jgi:hypothetical protein